MKHLLIIRHAKAANEGSGGDFFRPLKNSGEKNALDLAKTLNQKSIKPQIIYSSPALRAKTTATIIAEYNGFTLGNPIPNVYEATDQTLLAIINGFSNEFDFIGLTGHNPGLSTISTYLSSSYQSLTTCGAILLEFDIDDWKLISADTATVSWIYEP